MFARWIVFVVSLGLVACGKDNNVNGDSNVGNMADMGSTEDMIVPLDWGDAGPGFDVGPLQETLPLEVLGAPGTELTVAVNAEGVGEAEDAGLRLQIAGLTLADAAELEVNFTYTIDLGEEFVRPLGGWAEAVVPLDPAQLRNGENYFTFRWTGDTEEYTGYRVVMVELEVGSATSALADWDDPSSWAPADPDPEAIERGRRYWQNLSPNGGPVCAECHATSGADLQYYAYSDVAISAYAQLLGYDENEAADLTNYIRSLDVGRDGRPWVAPFQPGPNNYGAAGGGVQDVVSDEEVRAVWLTGEPASLEWDHAAGIDPYSMPATFQATVWNRWLPRQIDNDWFDRSNGLLDQAIGAYEDDPTIETAHALLDASIAVGFELASDDEHESRINLMRWTAVKLWDWSRQQSFYEDHHGFPDEMWGIDNVGSPPYMAEVGFALYESGLDSANEEAARWWLAQMAADYGRGRSTGLRRPLDYHALLTASQGIAGPNETAWFYVLGSWEESRGELIDFWGTEDGPVRLLPPALPFVPDDLLPLLWFRFVEREADHAIGGGTFTPGHLSLFQRAWSATCDKLDSNTKEQLVARTPDALRESIVCE